MAHDTTVEGTLPGVPLIAARNIHKSFGGVRALNGVSLDIRAGEVHGLVGANGAGKSTLIHILAGLEHPEAGVIAVDGRPTAIDNPQAAARAGLSFIHQELALVPGMSVVENIMLGAPTRLRFGMVDWKRVAAEVEPIARRVGITFPLAAPIASLSTAERWLVSICRALVRRSRLIVMDEPTASLSVHEAGRLHAIVREVSRSGVAVLYVSHRLDEILDLCHRVTVFRDGRSVAEMPSERLTRRSLIEAIVGGPVPDSVAHPTSSHQAKVVLRIEDLRKAPRVRGATFELHHGEVLGLAGLVGAGRSELVRLIFGADRPEGGAMTIDGRPHAPRSPAVAMRAGIGLVPEERRSEGLVLLKSIAFNLGLANLHELKAAGLPMINRRRQANLAYEMIERLRIKAPGVRTPVGRLSGGNQQKVVIGKWLTRRPRILILDEPTRGVDIGARGEIHRLIRTLAADGMSVIVISSEAEELPELCDRVLVMVEGRITRALTGTEITRNAIVQSSYADHDGGRAAAGSR
jgi:ABC-type sugar transport system ATPase subunit